MHKPFMILVAAVALMAGSKQSSHADEQFSLVIDPFTGATSLRNDATAAVDLDGYFVTSPSVPVLDPMGWNSLVEQDFSGWSATSSETGNRLGEVNLFGSTNIGPGESLSIGNAYTAFSPSGFGEQAPGVGAINFSYTLANEPAAFPGDVEFSARNTVVLVVDPATGNAELVNQSGFDINLDSYLVKSNESVLNANTWEPLSSSDSNWTSAVGAANRIAEGNLFDSTFLAANGGSISIGSPINTSLLEDEKNLEMEFTATGFDASIVGGVLFTAASVAEANADFDGDGDVDSTDLATWNGNYGNSGGLANGDANGDALVGGSDFLAWQRQYTGSSSALTDSAFTAVPEPTTLWLILSGIAMTNGRPRRRALAVSGL